MPENIKREKILHTIPDDKLYCDHCCQKLRMMGKDVYEQLEFIPAKLYVKQHRRYKYGCGNGCTVKTASMPEQPIPKGLPGPGLLAFITIGKYQDALPLYRQEQILQRYGCSIARSTLCGWIEQVAFLLEPIVIKMKQELISSNKLHTDDTPIAVLSKGKTTTGRFWVYVADGTSSKSCTIYDYSANRRQEIPQRFLSNYQGYLQADAYPGYNKLYESGAVIEVGCWAHARRKFFDIAVAVKDDDTIATDMLKLIQELYHTDNQGKHLSNTARYYYRKYYCKPILSKIHIWLKKHQYRQLPKTPIALAINYTVNNWRALNNFLRDANLELDNNRAERAIKPLVIGRKNYLFAGSHEGGKRAAIIYSIIETCKQNNINTYDYLKDILTRIPSCLQKNIGELLPYNWQLPNTS